MSFLDKPKKERNAAVKKYLEMTKRIQQRNENDRIQHFTHQEELHAQFAPIIKGQQQMTENITKQLQPIKQELRQIKKQEEEEEHGFLEEFGPITKVWLQKVLQQSREVDMSFGIRFDADGEMRMGNKVVTFEGDDLIIDGVKYTGTPGLWKLITGVSKADLNDHRVTQNDMIEYIKILHQTVVLHQNFDRSESHPRSNSSVKWRMLLRDIWESTKENKEEQESGDHSGTGLFENPIDAGDLYVERNGKCVKVKVRKDGMLLSPVERIGRNGAFVKVGERFYEASGLFPKRKYPLLNILL